MSASTAPLVDGTEVWVFVREKGTMRRRKGRIDSLPGDARRIGFGWVTVALPGHEGGLCCRAERVHPVADGIPPEDSSR